MALPLAQLPARDEIHAGASRRIPHESRLSDASRLIALWHLASLDAPTVAVVWSLAFAWASRIQVGDPVLLVLALMAWCAYVSDRLLDARSGVRSRKESALRERHYFHWRHRRLMAPLAVLTAWAAGAMAATLIPAFLRIGGLILGAAALFYFLGVHAAPRPERRRFWLQRKELLVAVLFTAGCVLPAWGRFHLSGAEELSRLWFWISAAYFVALAWLNCSSIELWESDDKSGQARDGDASLGRMGQSSKPSAALAVALAGLVLAIVAAPFDGRPAALLLSGAVSALLLELLDRKRLRMTPLSLRIAADVVLLTPVVFLLK